MPPPPTNPNSPSFVVTITLIVADVARSVAFYRDVLGATVQRQPDTVRQEPAYLQLANTFLTINVGGAPTDDKPTVIATPPRHPDELDRFMNLRVSDIEHFYKLWQSRGATFVTEPKTHFAEKRCYIRDPDGYLIEVGQTTFTPSPLDLYR